jgi:hypothetical protein
MMECAALCSFLSRQSCEDFLLHRFPERGLDRCAISLLASSRPGREIINSVVVAGL